MSTMLKSAALSLLSKTLQTFLSKYISDVDVEGVALPSLYDIGSSSGWGARLCNVRLRQGVELQTLTIKRKRVKKRKHPSSSSQRSKPIPHFKANTSSLNDYDSKDGKRSLPESKTGEQQQQPRDKYAEVTVEGEKPPMKQLSAVNDSHDDEDEVSIDLPTSNVTYYSTDEDNDRPGTPVQNSKSFLACFYNSSSKETSSTDQPLSNTPPSTRNNDATDDEKDHVDDIRDGTSGNRIETDTASAETRSFCTTPAAEGTNDAVIEVTENSLHSNVPKERPTSPILQDLHDEQGMGDGEEYDEDYDQPMSLRLGDGGKIGTLDIRLVGKDLHILVEDAFLTVEAVPIVHLEGEDDGKDAEETSTSEACNIDSMGRENIDTTNKASDTKKEKNETEPPTSKTQQKADPPRTTVGERVMAENVLARAIASIPHLFLRDVRIHFIVRDKAIDPGPKSAETDQMGSQDNDEEESKPTTNDIFLELAIDFLSVTSGEDILANFQQSDEESTGGTMAEGDSHRSISGAMRSKPPMASIPSFSSVDSTMEQNEFLVRHIRTGRGPEGGIWLKILAPETYHMPRWDENDPSSTWARYGWLMATEYHFCKCSGLDIRARIHLGTKKEVARYTWFYDDDDDEYDNEQYLYDENTLDSMLWSVDYVAPGPQLPFPPVSPHMSRGGTPLRDRPSPRSRPESPQPEAGQGNVWPALQEGADIYIKDKNGIQSCKVPSNFHRVARGMTPGSCKDCDHLPCETCFRCWDRGSAPKVQAMPLDSALDASSPMAGLVLQVTIRELLEINADRTSLEALGLIRNLFTNKSRQEAGQVSFDDNEAKVDKATVDATIPEESTLATASSSKSLFAGFLTRSAKKPPEKEDPVDAFPSYMQPENIQVVGLHLSKIIFRVHIMRKRPDSDQGLSFCYWDMVAHCVNMDYNLLSCPLTPSLSGSVDKKSFQDMRFDVGHLSLTEFKGLNRNKLMLLGLRHPDVVSNCYDSSTLATALDREDEPNAPWPSTASILLDVPPPLETLMYKSRERHGVQFRYLSVVAANSSNKGLAHPTARSQINMKLGAASIKMPWKAKTDAETASAEAIACLFGDQEAGKPADQPAPREDNHQMESKDKPAKKQGSDPTKPESLLSYKIRVDGGDMNLPPLMNVRLPKTEFVGEQSSTSGMFMESVLHNFQFSFGEQTSSTLVGRKRLSLIQLANLPENLRLRILLFLDELNPLEEALKVKKETNHFMRYRAVNRAIVDTAKSVATSSKRISKENSAATTTNRRQTLMSELLKLDDDELDDLLASYHSRSA